MRVVAVAVRYGRPPPTALARRLGDADVDEQPLEPGIESVRIAEAAQVTPGDHQRVLQRVLGPIDIAEDPLGDREESVASNADQIDVRRPIPIPRRINEIAIHRFRPSGTHRGCPPTLLVGTTRPVFNLRLAQGRVRPSASGRTPVRTA